MKTKLTYKHTIFACFTGYIVQSMLNFAPLLYAMFQTKYSITLSQLSVITIICFSIQLFMDFFAGLYVNRIGYRACAIIAHVCSTVGFILLSFLPTIMDPFVGLAIATLCYSMGCGLTEVIISPMVEACPTKNKAKMMGILHSFYAWGSLSVILITTFFISVFGIDKWAIMSRIWAIIPALNCILFCFVPIYKLNGDKEQTEETVKTEERKVPKFLVPLFVVIMLCAGAMEICISQWASAFAENGLGVSKTLGDIFGPAMFALLLALGRVFYANTVGKIHIHKFLVLGTVGSVISYMLIAFVPLPYINLLGCGLGGLSVSMMWPATLSLATTTLGESNAKTFGFLAFGGDLGCMLGPSILGFVSDAFNSNMHVGFGVAMIFPLIAMILLISIKKYVKE